MRRGCAFTAIATVIAGVLGVVAGPATALSGGPDAFGYRFADSNEPGGPAFNFQDISATGTDVFGSPCDDCLSGPLTLPFPFSFYGVAETQVVVSSNGFLTFTPGSNGCCSGLPIPTAGSPDDFIAGLWADLFPPGAGATIKSQTLGVTPGRVFVVQFTGVPIFASADPPVTMQFKLFEGSTAVEVHYQSVSVASHVSTAGIENATGTIGLQYLNGSPTTLSSLAVRYSLAASVTVNQAGAQADPTSTSPINFTAAFSGPVTGFTGPDVSFAGSTAPGTLSAVVTGGPSTYNVAVSGMTGAGTVVASIPAARVDGGNTASTSTDNSVLFQAGDTTPPACAVVAVRRPPARPHSEMDVRITDTQSGLLSVTNITVSNGVISITPSTPFAAGTTQATLTAVKTVEGQTTTFAFDVTDRAGNTRHCT